MRFIFSFFLFFFIFIFSKIKGEEEEPLKKPERKIKHINFDNIDTKRKSQTIPLNASNFDLNIKNGTQNRWLVIFYAETCRFCKNVKSLIDKIIEEKNYKSINNIKFGSVDVDYNLKLKTRFDIDGIPSIILIENNKMLEISNFPHEKTLIKSIEIENIEKENGVKDFPHEISFYIFIKKIVIHYLTYFNNKVNKFLKKHNINLELNFATFCILILIYCSIISTILLIGLNKFFSYNENNTIINNNNKINANISLDKKIDDNHNLENNSSEEMKKIIEEKKEQDIKEKLDKKKENNNITELNKKEKKE